MRKKSKTKELRVWYSNSLWNALHDEWGGKKMKLYQEILSRNFRSLEIKRF